jgi:glycerol-3-phosphate dehydrogenase
VSIRSDQIEKAVSERWDLVVIGGGATGLGVAVEAVTRGYKVVLLEGADFAKGTSSRSTKLLHGGVRYLAQGDFALVKEALEERGLLARNAAHLFRNQTFVIPSYRWWEKYYYGFGLKLYDLLSAGWGIGRSRLIGRQRVLHQVPAIKASGLNGGVMYQDGQFDDARLAVNLAQTARDHGALVINYAKVNGFIKDEQGMLEGVQVKDQLNGRTYSIKGTHLVNATGVFSNKLLKLDDKEANDFRVVPSQGIHLVLDRDFLDGQQALMIPKTSDGRVLFAIPWHEKVVIGTTDTPVNKPSYEPRPLEEEVDFILATARSYLSKAPRRSDVRAVFAGLRPLVAPKKDKSNTKEISRGHKIAVSPSGLITILGGKWTTYRKMGERVVDVVLEQGRLEALPSVTRELSIHGNRQSWNKEIPDHLRIYGSDAERIHQLEKSDPLMSEKWHPEFPYTRAQVVWAIREEMACTLEDVIARRARLLFLDAGAAMDAAPRVAAWMALELGKPGSWVDAQVEEFVSLARGYSLKVS